MSELAAFYRSSLGKKTVMAVSGLVLFGFVVAHMAGNLKMYLGPEAYNHYAEGLRELGAPFFPHGALLWVARIVLLAALAAHVMAAVQVTLQSRSARRVGYVRQVFQQTDYAARTMRWGGVLILLFVVYHLLHLTVGARAVHPEFVSGDVYSNVVTGFSHPLVAGAYVLANLALGFHLFHGLWSLFQTLGWNHPRYNSWRRGFAAFFSFVVSAGNISFPLAVLAGVVK